MKVSIIHPERRCAQQFALDLVTGYCAEGEFPEKLLPTQRFELPLRFGAPLAFVASAAFKQYGPAPLAIELEAEEGETLSDDTVGVYCFAGLLRERVADVFELTVTERQVLQQLAMGHPDLVKLPAPITLAGDHQQYGIVSVEISPERDVLITLAVPDAGAPA